LNGVKSQWDLLQDVIADGYNEAHKLHLGALKEMKRERLLKEQREAESRGMYMFVFSVVSVGFAGGIVGGLFGSWVGEAGISVGAKVVREGIKGVATRATQQIVKAAIPQDAPRTNPSPSPYASVSPEGFDVYIKKKTEIDNCFAITNAWLQKMKDTSNLPDEQWGADVGWDILNSFRKNCPLLTDAPDPDPAKLPSQFATAKSAELAMWVAWANAREWPWWNKVYDQLDRKPSDYSSTDPRFMIDVDVGLSQDGLISEQELAPVQKRFAALGMLGAVDMAVPAWFPKKIPDELNYTGPRSFDYGAMLDLRKLRSLPLTGMSNLPFNTMKGLDFSRLDTPQLRGKFLDGLSDVRPFHVKAR
jgi:hypothetical protein